MKGIDILVAAFAAGIVAFAIFRKVKRSKKRGGACCGCDLCDAETDRSEISARAGRL
jgi:hypothetical protein